MRIQTRATTSGGVRHIAKWRDPEGHDRSKSFSREKDAINHLAKMTVAKDAGTYQDPNRGRMRLGEYAQRWLAGQAHLAESSRETYGRLINKHISLLGSRPLDSLKRDDIQGWVGQLTIAPASVEAAYSLLASILNSAVLDERLGRSPCKAIKLPKADDEPIVPLSLTEVLAIAAAAPRLYYAAIMTAAETGMRIGEFAGLTEDRIDWLPRPTIRVERQWLRSRKFGPPKTSRSRRQIPVSQATARRLSEHLAEFGALAPHGLVFHAPRSPLAVNHFNVVWHEAREKAGVRYCTPHDLRHFHASRLIGEGWDVVKVAARLGHKGTAETYRTYAHLWPRPEDEERRALEALAIAV